MYVLGPPERRQQAVKEILYAPVSGIKVFAKQTTLLAVAREQVAAELHHMFVIGIRWQAVAHGSDLEQNQLP
jgi:hypothetical protein